ncbi:MAG: fructose-6-phosphate aldolase [Omnitrophica bacterium RIFCSPLOWO2_01_FULL_45_10]|nr:MAG: fructose-6-phosphate aldolase [Omnitrophica bacterium RIFCSPLOWO2_01_FULL_45_10]
MKLFIDTANIDEIKEANALGIIDGVTTNPSLIAKEGRDFITVVKEICSIVDGPISAEAVSSKSDEIIKEARNLTKVHKNIVVKIPITAEGLKATKVLSREGVKTNLTLCFSPTQALLAAKAGATYVSPFIGRLDDISEVGIDLIRDIKAIFTNYGIKTQIIVASIRNSVHVLEAAKIGADIATVPYNVLKALLKHPLTDIGIDRFLKDWQSVSRK